MNLLDLPIELLTAICEQLESTGEPNNGEEPRSQLFQPRDCPLKNLNLCCQKLWLASRCCLFRHLKVDIDNDLEPGEYLELVNKYGIGAGTSSILLFTCRDEFIHQNTRERFLHNALKRRLCQVFSELVVPLQPSHITIALPSITMELLVDPHPRYYHFFPNFDTPYQILELSCPPTQIAEAATPMPAASSPEMAHTLYQVFNFRPWTNITFHAGACHSYFPNHQGLPATWLDIWTMVSPTYSDLTLFTPLQHLKTLTIRMTTPLYRAVRGLTDALHLLTSLEILTLHLTLSELYLDQGQDPPPSPEECVRLIDTSPGGAAISSARELILQHMISTTYQRRPLQKIVFVDWYFDLQGVQALQAKLGGLARGWTHRTENRRVIGRESRYEIWERATYERQDYIPSRYMHRQ